MNLLITGIAGFVGSRLALLLPQLLNAVTIVGIDNLSRRGSEINLPILKKAGIQFFHGDIRNPEDLAELPPVDWIIDCAANPSVLAGLKGGSGQLVSHNLIGTLHLLEKCRREQCGFLMLSTSRVYSISALASIPMIETESRFTPDPHHLFPQGFSLAGINELFSTQAPISLYGATKLASEIMVAEYSTTYQFPAWINRCGVIAGGGQFGKIDQGIFAYWIYQWILDRPLAYIGFNGTGKQVRDFLSPQDLANLIAKQITNPQQNAPIILNLGGGLSSSFSLKELSQYCHEKTGFQKSISAVSETRPFDIPYYVSDNSEATRHWYWQPEAKSSDVLDEIFSWAYEHQSLIENGF